jgi:hypothetical protein
MGAATGDGSRHFWRCECLESHCTWAAGKRLVDSSLDYCIYSKELSTTQAYSVPDSSPSKACVVMVMESLLGDSNWQATGPSRIQPFQPQSSTTTIYPAMVLVLTLLAERSLYVW